MLDIDPGCGILRVRKHGHLVNLRHVELHGFELFVVLGLDTRLECASFQFLLGHFTLALLHPFDATGLSE